MKPTPLWAVVVLAALTLGASQARADCICDCGADGTGQAICRSPRDIAPNCTVVCPRPVPTLDPVRSTTGTGSREMRTPPLRPMPPLEHLH